VTLIAPLFLAGLLAIGLPLWLHRLSAENPNRQRFSSLMFLEAGEPRRVLAKTLQYLLLLALRIAVIALLVLAFVQPALWRPPQAAATDGARLHIIVLDTSASMAAGDRWERAVDAAADVIDALDAEDRAELIAAGRVTEIVTAPTMDRGVLRQSLATVEPGVFPLDFGQLMRALDGIVRGAELPVALHLVTDAQQTGLPTRFGELAPRAAVELTVHNVAGGEGNVAIEILAGSALDGELAATVRSFEMRSLTRTVQLEHNGARVEEQTIELAPGARAQVSFGALTLAAGPNRVRVILSPGDELPYDDTRILALRRPEPRPVLLVASDLRAQNTFFVNAAMQTLAALALEPTTISVDALAEATLADYEFVVVIDAGALGDAGSAALSDYVESGGALLMGLAARSSGLAEIPLTGQRLTGPGLGGDVDTYTSIGTLDASHPALRGLDALRMAKFFRYTAITPDPADDVLMSLETGAPLLLERSLGDGRVLVFTSSLDREWNDLAVQPVFVPFIAGLSNHLLGGAGFSSEAALGSTLALRAMGLSGGQIFDPAGNAALGLGGTDDVLLDEIGFYELAGGGRNEVVAVNFDVRESDLQNVDAATLERWQALGQPSPMAPVDAAAPGAPEAVPTPLGYWILFLVLLALGVESWVGNWHLRIRRGIAA
jgi:hypothetical protein